MKLDIPAGDFAGYIFDLDGTLIDSMPIHYVAWDAAMRRAGLREKLSEELFYSLGGVPTRRVAELIGQHYGLTVDVEQVFHEKEAFFTEKLAGVRLIEPVVAVAREVAKTRPLAIASGRSQRRPGIAWENTAPTWPPGHSSRPRRRSMSPITSPVYSSGVMTSMRMTGSSNTGFSPGASQRLSRSASSSSSRAVESVS